MSYIAAYADTPHSYTNGDVAYLYLYVFTAIHMLFVYSSRCSPRGGSMSGALRRGGLRYSNKLLGLRWYR